LDIEEYKKRIKAIEDEAGVKKKSLGVEYAMSHNSIAIGDVIEDHIGRIKVEKISVQMISSGNAPICVYFGIEITKAGTPSQKGTKRWANQSNLKI